MKIVCEACQAKYSIADEKVRGKVFKIRCKKCGHVIVVRGSGEVSTTGAQASEFAAAPVASPDLAPDAGWHIVVEGEQVGPLSEADVRARLSRAEITVDTYIWREGLPDWVKVSSLPEFGEGDGQSPFAAGTEPGEVNPFEADGPTAIAQPSRPEAFAAGTPSGGVPAMSELFSAPPGVDAATSVTGAPGFGSFEPSVGGESYGRSGGNGSIGAMQPAGLTAQRHENSVLFSLANLEALAKPSPAPVSMPRSNASPLSSTSATTEGSGLIDIRAMANMTLGGAAAKEAKGDDLPAFSAPQFSPVAPVLLPMGSSGTPRWAIVLFSVLGAAILALGVVVVKMFTTSPAPPPMVAVAPPAPVAAAEPVAPTQPPATPPPVVNETLPPRDPASAKPPGAGEGAPAERPTARANRVPGPRRGPGVSRNPVVSIPDRPASAAGAAGRPPVEARPKPKDDIEALLEAASGNRRQAAPARREEEEAAPPPVRAGEKAPPLDRDEIVKGMSAVMPRARDCYAQFKVPGMAMVKLTVSPSGRVGAATVTGKFAGTPSGNCVESALKTARFPPSAGRTFDYVVPLR